jgi:hypothetical protein
MLPSRGILEGLTQFKVRREKVLEQQVPQSKKVQAVLMGTFLVGLMQGIHLWQTLSMKY